MGKILTIVSVAIVLMSPIIIAAPSDEVIFKTDGNAPSDFDNWTFFWKMPVIDSGATLSYVVNQPDGKEYFRYVISGNSKPGGSIRSDFFLGFAGGDPKVFYNKEIVFKFMVDKGKIAFEPDSTFRFDFGKTVKAVKQ